MSAKQDMPPPSVTAVIQARLSSTRFPAKVLRDLAGKPILWHIVHRLRKSAYVNQICLATSAEASDDPLQAYAEELQIECIRGPRDNVLERFEMAMDALGGDFIVRICGDSPLIDAEILDQLVDELQQSGADWPYEASGVRSIHEGFNVVRTEALRRLTHEKPDDPVAMEHVTGYFNKDKDFAVSHPVYLPAEHRFEGARISVDTPADLAFLEAVYHELDAPAGEIDVGAVVALLKRRPDLLEINGHVRQKTATEATRMVAIRCDAGAGLGFGHVSRCTAIARMFRDRLSWGVVFYANPTAADYVEAAGFKCVRVPGEDANQWFSEALRGLNPDATVVDLRDETGQADIVAWKRAIGGPIAVIDDGSDRRLGADMAFYPPVPQVADMQWAENETEIFCGWDWITVGTEADGRLPRQPGTKPRLLVTMGGSDPFSLTELAVQALVPIESRLSIDFVIGKGRADPEVLADFIRARLPNAGIKRNVERLGECFAQSDLALCAFGVSAYEAVMLGCPPLIIALDDDAALAASALVDAGAARCLGRRGEVSAPMIAEAVTALASDVETMSVMSQRGQQMIDGQGPFRIAEAIARKATAGND